MANNVQRHVLPNGVRLLMIPMDGLKSIATAVKVGVGSRYETPKINGISHFLEHMVFKGTDKFPTTDEVNEIERIGGMQNAYTDIDITNYHNKVFGSDWKQALDINKELAIKPKLEQQYVDKERDVILEEMKRYDDQPAAKAEEAYHMMMYPGTKLGMRIIGQPQALHDSDAKTLRAYHDAWYKPDKIVVVLAGRMDDGRQTEIKAQVEEWFADLSGKADGGIELVEVKQDTPRVSVVTKPDAQQAHWVLGMHTFPRGHEDRVAWGVLNLLMGVGFTSRLFREVREKRGLCYQISSSSSNYEDTGSWHIYAGVAINKVDEAITATLGELTKMVEKGVDADEVEVSKKRMKTMLSFKSENPEFVNEFYGRREVFGLPVETLDEFLGKIDEVTKEQVDAAARRYFTPEHLNLAVVTQKADEKSLEKLLTL